MAAADEPDAPASEAGTPLVRVGVEQHNVAVVLDVAGEIDQRSASDLELTLTEALRQRPPVLVLDLSKVEFLASVGLGLLVSAHQQAAEHTSLRIVAHGSITLRPIQLMELDQQLAVYPSRDEALTL